MLQVTASGDTRIRSQDHLLILGRLIFVDAAAAGRGVGLGELLVFLLIGSTVDALLKDGLGLIELELGLEVFSVVGISAAVGAAASVGPVELVVNDLLAGRTPKIASQHRGLELRAAA